MVSYVPVRDLWSPLSPSFERSIFVVLVGYIDESISSEKPYTFGLSCVFAYGSTWSWAELAWSKILEEKNQELATANRKKLSRFHAVDLNNFKEEYKDWDGNERTQFTAKFIKKVFGQHELFHIGFTVSLRDVADAWPNYSAKAKNFAYYSLLKMILIELSPAVKRLFVPHTKIVLIHDRCAYDGVLLEAFNSVKNDDKFEDRDVLTTIAAMGWEDCIPLQPADFLAYEVMKESQRLEPEVMEKKSRPIRKSLESLRAKESFLGATYSVSKQNLLNLRKTITEKAERRMAEGDE